MMAEQIEDLVRSPSISAFEPGKRKIIRLRAEMPDVALLPWLAAQKDGSKVYWSDRTKEFEVAGVGVADLVTGKTLVGHDFLFHRLRSRMPESSKDVRYYGGLRFSTESVAQDGLPWQAFGFFRFVLPRFELYRSSHSHGTQLVCNLVPDIDVQNLQGILHQLDVLSFPEHCGETEPLPSIRTRRDGPNQQGWVSMIEEAIEAIKQGALEKVVLARQTTFEFSQDLSPLLLLNRLRGRSDGCFHFCIQVDSTRAFLGASPERLYLRRGRTIKTEAVAGTRARGATLEEDERLGKELLCSCKDLKEQAYVSKAIAKTLSNLCRSYSINGDNTPVSLLKLARVQHLVSRFKGELKHGITDSHLLQYLHPTPAVGGCPTEKAARMIGELEPFDRGWYTGPVGWVGPDAAEFAVGIRSGLVDGHMLHLFSGGGIVNGSTPKGEWDEIENKLSNFVETIGCP